MLSVLLFNGKMDAYFAHLAYEINEMDFDKLYRIAYPEENERSKY